MVDALKEAEFSLDRPVSKLLYHSEAMRIVVFGLNAGQEIPPLTTSSASCSTWRRGRAFFSPGAANGRRTPGPSSSRNPTNRTVSRRTKRPFCWPSLPPGRKTGRSAPKEGPAMETITRDMVINDVIRKHPATIKVFNEYKVDSCCGGGAPIGTTAKRTALTSKPW